MPVVQKPALRVAVVEDEHFTREALRKLLDGSGRCKVSGAFSCMEDALPGIVADLPDVVVVDIGLPGISGVDGIRILRGHYPQLALLVFSVYEDDEHIFEAVRAGACGYLLKTMQLSRMVESIEDVMGGGAPMSPRIARRILQLFRVMRPPEPSGTDLSPHEIRLLRLLAGGHTYKSAALGLGVTSHAVSFHLRNIYEKLHVHSKAEAVGKATRIGILN